MLNPPNRSRWAAPADLAEELGGGLWYRAPHLDLLSDQLARVARTPSSRVIVTMPPQHGKTELVSRWGVVWALEREPAMRVMLASYGESYAARHGRWVRNRIRDRQDVLGVRLAPDSTRMDEWETTAGGGMVSVGVGGGITGRGGDLIIIDDPVKGRRDVESRGYRDQQWGWYTDDLSSRLRPSAAIILVMTRWHRDDLAGRLLAEEAAGGEAWEVFHLPAIAEEPHGVEPCPECQGDGARYKAGRIESCGTCEGSGQVEVEAEPDALGREPGDPLWPARYDLAALEATRKRLGPYGWASLYQGRPIPKGGGSFWNDDDLREARARAPRGIRGELGADLVRVVVAVDPADSDEPGADETGIVVAGRERHGVAGVLADRSGSMSTDAWARAAVQACLDFNADALVYEANKGGKNLIGSAIRTAAAAMGERCPKLIPVSATHGKGLRAEPVHQLYREALVWHAAIWPDLEEQMRTWRLEDPESPDRLDALVHALTELMLKRKGTLSVT